MFPDASPEYPFDAPPAPGTRLRVAEGIDWVRQPLPFALDHVNCWLLGEGGADEGTTLVDTGIADDRTRTLWEAALGGARPERLLVTHFHPDHAGLAGWFAKSGSALLGSALESAFSHALWHTEPREAAAGHAEWYRENGLPEAAVAAVAERGHGYRAIVAEPPAPGAWRTLGEGDELVLGGRRFRVLVGRGHAPDMLMLHDAAGGLLIAADQVLPRISPNVSLMPRTVDPDPLASFLDSLAALEALPADTLVLPSHGLPFRGLHARLETLAAHHAGRLDRVRDACREPLTAYALFAHLFNRELDDQQLSFALGESLAHLVHLERRGELERRVEGGVQRFVVSR